MAAALFDAPIGGDHDEAQRLLDQAAADLAMGRALDHARALGGRRGIRQLRDYQGKIAAVEAELLAEHVTGDGDTRRAERLLSDGKTSKREARKRAARAKAVGENAELADKMASGQMSEEQVDVIADASAKTDGHASTDDELIDRVAAVSPEQGKGIVDDYVAERATADGVQTEHDRQRALRRAINYYAKKNGLNAITIEGDGVATKQMWDAIEKRADEMYREAGGRNLPERKHPRTYAQRLFDAAHELICGTNPPTDDADDTDCEKAKPERRPRIGANIVIGLTVDKVLGLDPAAVATQIGFGPIPDSILAEYAEHADIFAALYDREGNPLWLARLNRHATLTQRIALILRDKACVLCGTDHNRCHAHHTMPWNAPGKGHTNLDQLVLLCPQCHHQLHTDERTIYRDQDRNWKTRPATPDEIAPQRTKATRNQVRRE